VNLAIISIAQQRLTVRDEWDNSLFSCRVNSAKNGVGCVQDSGCTPLGAHYVRASIGQGLSPFALLKGRRATGAEWTPELMAEQPEGDWILGRILWLCGLEKGVNRGGAVDTFRRYIYVHGSPPWHESMSPSSHGCIRVQPSDMLKVFDLLPYGSRVSIET